MKYQIFLLFVLLSFATCKNATNEPATSELQEEIATENSSSGLTLGCYSYSENNNTIELEITSLDNGVTGNLSYAIAEKDKNTGTLEGEIFEGKLYAEYTFMSEGMTSTREVAFKIQDGQLFEGFGKLDETGMAFADITKLNYSSNMPLTKTDCQ